MGGPLPSFPGPPPRDARALTRRPCALHVALQVPTPACPDPFSPCGWGLLEPVPSRVSFTVFVCADDHQDEEEEKKEQEKKEEEKKDEKKKEEGCPMVPCAACKKGVWEHTTHWCRHQVDPNNRLYESLRSPHGWTHHKTIGALDAYSRFLTLKVLEEDWDATKLSPTDVIDEVETASRVRAATSMPKSLSSHDPPILFSIVCNRCCTPLVTSRSGTRTSWTPKPTGSATRGCWARRPSGSSTTSPREPSTRRRERSGQRGMDRRGEGGAGLLRGRTTGNPPAQVSMRTTARIPLNSL